MKQLLLPALLATIGFSVSALEVSTTPTAKSSVIEEFTGIHCGYCPQGHSIASQLQQSWPEDVFVVAIHAGGFAEPSRSEPDFRTEKGTVIHDYFGASGYPSGMTSRRDMGRGVVQGRGDWGPGSRTIVGETSPVNLAMESEWDAATCRVTVRVKGYFVESMTDPRLTVYVLQNNILGPQSGGGMGVDYPHRHMLRDMLQEQIFGDPLAEKEAGKYFEKEYSAVMPEQINGVPFTAYDMELLAFVAEGEGEIMKAVESFPEVAADESTRFIVAQEMPLIGIGNTYALDYLEVYLKNWSGEAVTTAAFDVTLGGETRRLQWSGNIAPHSGETVRIPLGGWWKAAYESDTNNYRIRLAAANGREPALEVKSISGSFKDLPEWSNALVFKIRTDLDAADNRYRILDETGAVVKEFGPYPSGENKDYEERVALDDGKVYGFEVSDAWGDGIYRPRGNVKIYSEAGTLQGQMLEISDYGQRVFFRASASAGIGSPDGVAEMISERVFTIDGCPAPKGYKGVAIRRCEMSDGTVRIEKVIEK